MCQRLAAPRNTLLLLGLVCLFHGSAAAHAIIVESSPAMHEVIHSPILEIRLRFNARIDGNRSRLTLFLPDGTARAVNLPRQTSPDSLSATVPQLSPGDYRLHWQVLADDGHITQGDIPFRMAVR